jgi:predicted amidohydrolase YtcJ
MKCALFALTLALLCGSLTLAAPPAADVVFQNGNVYTLDPKHPRAEAIAVANGRIVYVGTNAGAAKYAAKTTKVVDLKKSTVVPGMADSHCHIVGIGQREMTLNLEGTTSLDDLLAKVKARAVGAPKGEWISGRGWIETFWSPPEFPTRFDLDRVAPDNPVVLVRADGHAVVVNSKALEIAKVTKETKSPEGGEIMRDEKGEVTGMILDNAIELVRAHVPEPTEADLERAVEIGAKRELSLGWTEVQNAGSVWPEVERFEKLYRDGRVKLRIYNAIYGPGDDAKRLIGTGPILRDAGGRFTMRTIKVVFDGALGSTGAALLDKYADHDTSGFLRVSEEALYPMLVSALENGIQVETHAIGDRANRVILDLYERAFKEVPASRRKVKEPRWRVEHAQILSASDLPRFASLGVIASMQPSHAISDLYFAPRRLGMERLAGAYAWKSLLDSGATIAGGSDAPVERGEPMIEFYAAVYRHDLKGNAGEGWHLEQAVSRERALAMFTTAAAFAAFEEDVRGSIEPGKYADLTILSADIMTIPAPDILKTTCVMTVVNGEIVHDALR